MKLTTILALAATALAGETINNEVPYPSQLTPQRTPAYVWQLTAWQHLKTEVVTAVDCKRPTVAGDKIHVHCTSRAPPPPPQHPDPNPPTNHYITSKLSPNTPQTVEPSSPTAPSSTLRTAAASPSASLSERARSSRAGTRVFSTCALARRGSSQSSLTGRTAAGARDRFLLTAC